MPFENEASQIYLGFDFGMKRIGIAIGQVVTKTARPLETLAAKQGEPDWSKVEKLVNKWNPSGLVVGIPLNMDGTEQAITARAKAFAQALKAHTQLPVYEMDERLTTKEAREQLFTQGGYKALQDGQVDQVAAQLILENWFASKSTKNTD